MNINKKYYTGIGARDVPIEIMSFMEIVGKYLNNYGYTLRSGGAMGSDISFENGAGENKEIFIPWKGFNNSNSTLFNTLDEAFEISSKYHPRWDFLKHSVKKLHARNVHQVLGVDLKSPSTFLCCYTKCGKDVGGTAQALRIARDFNIPIFNFGSYEKEIFETKKCLELKNFLQNLDNYFI